MGDLIITSPPPSSCCAPFSSGVGRPSSPPGSISVMTIDKFSLFRIISFSIAGGDVLQTIPGTYKLYRKQFVNGLGPVCFFYAMARYMSIISLISNGIGFFGTNFTPASCRRFYMLPNATAMLAGMAVQVLVFIRTYAISGRSIHVWFGLGALMLACFPVQVKSSSTGRAGLEHRVHTHMVMNSGFNVSKFMQRVLRNGLLYTLVVFIANFWVVLEFAGLMSTGAASTLPLAVVMIAAQHLILSTQRLTSDEPSSTDDFRPSQGQSVLVASGPARFFHANTTTQDVELQSGVFVVTDTYVQPSADPRKADYGRRPDQTPA
ncbi:hypothetical protein B0H17DRAFT_429938 [Mycena rosella]|uniref:Uncharacterized protein n=1 Tax=Mycena rosella TaxID=1033263 RepID=A0AAD7CH39_MYCRO|nr:hypothetical protein B0H17DRAFT_429938 [Mycena rosella]